MQGDALAWVALVLAVVTLFLDVAFFFYATYSQNRFLNDANARQDRLIDKQIETFGKMQEAIAQVSERASLVQGSVNNQLDKLIGFATERATSVGAVAGSEISEPLQLDIQLMKDQISILSQMQGSNASVGQAVEQLQNQLTELGNKVSSLPEAVALSARDSIAAAARDDYSQSSPSDADRFLNELIEFSRHRVGSFSVWDFLVARPEFQEMQAATISIILSTARKAGFVRYEMESNDFEKLRITVNHSLAASMQGRSKRLFSQIEEQLRSSVLNK